MKNLLKPSLILSFALTVIGTSIALDPSNIAPGCKATVGAQPALSSGQNCDRLAVLG
jgi:hypothetical protein